MYVHLYVLDMCNYVFFKIWVVDSLPSLPISPLHQSFTIEPDILGITHIEDLSPMDMVKVRSLSLLELTVVFDDHNIPLRPRRPPRTKSYPGTYALVHVYMYMCVHILYVCTCTQCHAHAQYLIILLSCLLTRQ